MGICPDEHTLLRYAAGELGPAATERLDAHIDGCSACTELVAHAVRELGARPSAAEGEESELDEPPALASFDAMPDAIDRYLLVQRIGSGGMGTVWAAFDPQLDRNVALKVLRPGAVDRTRFMRREARALAALTHPNVVQIFAVGSWALPGRAPSIYLVMELVEGEDLRRWCSRPARSEAEILAAYRQAGRGLAAAHAAGLVHRDFKPDNVLIAPEGPSGEFRVRVTDFGLARTGPRETVSAEATLTAAIAVEDLGATQAGVVMGTPAYMAPEQRVGTGVDARADQYAFCVSLWEALTGARPDDDDPERRAPPPRIRTALVRGLARDPARRWPDMDALLRALFDPPRARARLIACALSLPIAAIAWSSAARPADAHAEAHPRISAALVATTALREGAALRSAGSYPAAREALARAHELASAHGLPRIAAAAATQQVFVVGSIGEDRSGGATWVRHAETAIARLPADERGQAEADLATTRGHWLHQAGRADEARAQFEAALDFAERTHGPDHPDLVFALNDVGNMHIDRDPELALVYFSRALELARREHGEHDTRVSMVLGNIGALHEHRGDIELAAEYGERVLAIEEADGGPDHPDVARASYNLGVFQDALGDDVAAEASFRRALSIWTATLGPDHTLVGRCYDNLGGMFYEAGDLAAAEREYNHALVLYEHALGPDAEALVTPLSGLTEIALVRGRGERALALSERALGLATQRSLEYRASMTFRVARALWAAGRHDEARARARRAIEQARADDDPIEEAADFVPQIESWLARPDDWRWPNGS